MREKYRACRQVGFVNLTPLLLIVASAIIVAGVLFRVNQSGNTQVQQVLSSSNENGSSSGSGSSGSGSSGSSDSGKSDDEDKSESSGRSSGPSPQTTSKPEEQKTEVTTDSGVRIQTETKKDGRVRTEIRFGEEEKIKTRTEEGRTRVDVYSGGVKVRLERREDKVVITVEREDGAEVEVGEDELVKIRQRLGRINVATAGAKLAVISGGIPALTDFPLKIDLSTNTLTVVTPAGEQTVTILPDQAVANLIAANVIDRLSGTVVAENVATRSAITAVSQIIDLGEEQGVPVYEIIGLKDQLLLGFIPLTTTVQAVVSAQNGQVLNTSQSLLDNLVSFFSFAQ